MKKEKLFHIFTFLVFMLQIAIWLFSFEDQSLELRYLRATCLLAACVGLGVILYVAKNTR